MSQQGPQRQNGGWLDHHCSSSGIASCLKCKRHSYIPIFPKSFMKHCKSFSCSIFFKKENKISQTCYSFLGTIIKNVKHVCICQKKNKKQTVNPKPCYMADTIRTVLTPKGAAICNYIQFLCHTQIPFWGSKDRGHSYLNIKY